VSIKPKKAFVPMKVTDLSMEQVCYNKVAESNNTLRSYVGTIRRPPNAEQEEKAYSAIPATEVGRNSLEMLEADK